jgi:hypothetical protein
VTLRGTQATPAEEATYHRIIAAAAYSFLAERAKRSRGEAAPPPTVRRGHAKPRIARPT